MDLDNFDFKPLTKGLGFDKKADESKTIPSQPTRESSASTAARVSTPASAPTKNMGTSHLDSISFEKPNLDLSKKLDTAKINHTLEAPLFEKPLEWNNNPPKTSRSIAEMLNSLPPSIDFFDEEKAVKQKEAKVYKPIGRIDYTPSLPEIGVPSDKAENYVPANEERADISLDNTLEKAFPKVGFRRPFFHQAVEVQPQFTEISTSFTSAILDGLVILGLTALLLVGLILITKIDLIAVVLHSRASLDVWSELGAVFMGVYLLYYMVARGFWGSTLGDWAFDIHLGTAEERLKWFYPYQVVFRMAVIALTGFVLFPLLSLIMKKDMASTYSKLRLYIKNY
jgi:hypothetical protein